MATPKKPALLTPVNLGNLGYSSGASADVVALVEAASGVDAEVNRLARTAAESASAFTEARKARRAAQVELQELRPDRRAYAVKRAAARGEELPPVDPAALRDEIAAADGRIEAARRSSRRLVSEVLAYIAANADEIAAGLREKARADFETYADSVAEAKAARERLGATSAAVRNVERLALPEGTAEPAVPLHRPRHDFELWHDLDADVSGWDLDALDVTMPELLAQARAQARAREEAADLAAARRTTRTFVPRAEIEDTVRRAHERLAERERREAEEVSA